VVVNLVIPKGITYVSTLHVEVACSEMVDTSGLPASITSCHPRDPPLAHFKNKEVSTFLHFPMSYLSQENLELKPSTVPHSGPRWIIPKVSVQGTPTPELMTA
jgi:hypothetical protein